MSLRAIKYLSPLLIYAGSLRAFTVTGFEIWLPIIYAWIVVPLLELWFKPNPANISETEEELLNKQKIFDYILYLIVVLQYLGLFLFLRSLLQPEMNTIDLIGRVWVMGMLCGVFGINVGHELGHRSSKFEQTLAKLLLLSSQYMHFFIEHNKGHHKRVATTQDPSSARYGESIYHFYPRTIGMSYISAWEIAARDMKKKNKPVISFQNEMIQFTLIQICFIGVIFYFFGWFPTTCYLIAAAIGILLLETVNYIEHYGLQRKLIAQDKFERAMPEHSWNSDHVIGRVMLFELSRHSDHHYLASRKYQVLRHHDNSPQMPTGYPGMMLLALVPPLWFYVMNKRVRKTQAQASPANMVINSPH